MENPIEDLLIRQTDPKLQSLLNDFARAIEEVVNFGTHLLNCDVKTNAVTDYNFPIIMSFRHILEVFDAVSVLVRAGCIDPSALMLRGALESYLGMKYMLVEKSEQRCLSFLVHHIHQEMKDHSRVIPNTQEGVEFRKAIGFNADEGLRGFIEPSKERIANLKALLNQEKFKIYDDEYKRTKKPIYWYKLFQGPSNLERLASTVNEGLLYQEYYRKLSKATHAVDILHGRISNDGIKQLRMPNRVQEFSSLAIITLIKAFNLYTQNRLPHHWVEFKDWYLKLKPTIQKINGPDLLTVVP